MMTGSLFTVCFQPLAFISFEIVIVVVIDDASVVVILQTLKQQDNGFLIFKEENVFVRLVSIHCFLQQKQISKIIECIPNKYFLLKSV